MKLPIRTLFFLSMIFLFSVISAYAQMPRGELRLLSLAPHITEIIFRLGAGKQLIGRSEFCLYPPEALKIEPVGGYLNVDYEKVVRLQPDLIFQFPNDETRRKLENLGFQVVDMPNETVTDIYTSIHKAAEILGVPERGESIIAGIKDTLDMISADSTTAGVPSTALLVIGRQPGSLTGLYVAGRDTYLSQIWEMCSGKNIFREVNARYFSVSKEDLLKRDIDIILEFHPGWDLTAEKLQQEQDIWSLFRNLNAVQKNHIFIFTDRLFVIPGPRISRIAVRFHDILAKIAESK